MNWLFDLIGRIIAWAWGPAPLTPLPPFHPRPDCPALFQGARGVPLDACGQEVTFPCGALSGCGGPNCRWVRQLEFPLPPPPRRLT